MSKVYGYAICTPPSQHIPEYIEDISRNIESLKNILYRPQLGFLGIDEAEKAAQITLGRYNPYDWSNPRLPKYSAVIYSIDSSLIPDFTQTPKIYEITEDIRQKLNIEEQLVPTTARTCRMGRKEAYYSAPSKDTLWIRKTLELSLKKLENCVNKKIELEQAEKEPERIEAQRAESQEIISRQTTISQDTIFTHYGHSQQPQNSQPNIPANAVGIKLVPMEQAAQPGWQPEQSPSDMDAWVPKVRFVSKESFIREDDNAIYECARMLTDMQQKREIAQKSNIFHAIHDQHMRLIDAQEQYSQPPRYTMPALAVLYDVNKQPTGIYIPSWEEIQTSLSKNNFRSDSLLSANINDPITELWMQAKIKAFDTQYKYPLPDNYQPPLISTIDENTKTPIVYEHYGNTRIDPEKTSKVKTNFNLKPAGGLWACEQNEVEQSWHSFTEDWRPTRADNKFVFELSSDAKILKIDSIEVIAYLQQHYPKDWLAAVEATYLKELFKSGVPALMVDWEKVSQDYDGIYYSHSALWNTFGPYDVNSLCVFNPDVVIVHERQGVLHFPKTDDVIQHKITEYFNMHDEYNDGLNINNDEHYFYALHEIASQLAEDSDTAAKFQYYTALSDAALASVNAIKNQTQVPLHNPECIAELNAIADEINIEQNLDEI